MLANQYDQISLPKASMPHKTPFYQTDFDCSILMEIDQILTPFWLWPLVHPQNSKMWVTHDDLKGWFFKLAKSQCSRNFNKWYLWMILHSSVQHGLWYFECSPLLKTTCLVRPLFCGRRVVSNSRFYNCSSRIRCEILHSGPCNSNTLISKYCFPQMPPSTPKITPLTLYKDG